MNKDNQTKANRKHHIIADTHANFSNSNDGGKTHSDDNANYTQWHTGFVQAMRLYLKDYENDLEFTDEFQLTRKPLSIDLTVVKKLDDITIKNSIGSFFRKHNILEYKSPKDELNLETFYKVQAYAMLYMIAPGNCDIYGTPINENDVTITIVRAVYPRNLMKALEKLGYNIHEDIENIYRIEGAQFPIQVAVTKPSTNTGEPDRDMIWLNVLSTDITKDTYNTFLSGINELDIKHSMFADAIFAIVSNVNEEKIEVWKEEQSMNDAMRRIMAKELKESRDEGLAEGRSEERNMMKEAMLTAKKEHISDASQLEALGFDAETSHSTIAILRELGVIS